MKDKDKPKEPSGTEAGKESAQKKISNAVFLTGGLTSIAPTSGFTLNNIIGSPPPLTFMETVQGIKPLTGVSALDPVSFTNSYLTSLTSDSTAEANKLRKQIDELRATASAQAKALTAATAGSDDQKRMNAELRESMAKIIEKEKLRFLLDRVHPTAQEHLLRSEDFRNQFLTSGECSAFVMAVDIRRSTELMLKARSAQQFADFITSLCQELSAIVVESYGVFDKFTGDGILAFFPDFYSGADAAYRVIKAADHCHASFKRHYRESRKSFKTVLTDVGLGIGIDYGAVRLVQVANGLTVVGEPVVYACRLSGAPPNVTLVNQPAYEEISTRFGGFCFAEEQRHEIKHEGAMLAYEVRLNDRQRASTDPKWLLEQVPTPPPPQTAKS